MSRLIAIIRATGSQGGSVIQALLRHPEYSPRAVTCNVGQFVRAILEQPGKTLPGRIVAGVDQRQTFSELMEMYGAARGITARSVQISKEDYVQLGDLMDKSHSYFEHMGGKAFTGTGERVLSKDNLQVEGPVATAKTFTSEG